MPTPLPVITDTYRVALEWNAFGAHATNVMHFRSPSPPADAAAIFTCFNAHVSRAMWDTVSDAAIIDTLKITPLDGTSATTDFLTGGGSDYQGGTVGDSIVAVAALLKLATPLRGRSYRGRNFLPFTAEGAQNGGTIAPVKQASAAAAWVTFIADCLADGTTPMQLVVASYKLATAEGVTSLSIETEAGTQKRRQDRLR